MFPCAGKDPLTEHGFHDATTDPDVLRAWWRRWPHANIGLACDAHSGLLALDVDPRNSGDEEFSRFERGHGELPPTPTNLTGGGGQHYVFQRPTGVSFRGKLADGIDIKANGYIILPPSIHPDTGRVYEWEVERRPTELPPAELPASVLTRAIAYEAREYGEPADDAAKSFLARAFSHAGWLGKRIDRVRINAWCPWESEHNQRSGSGGTVIFAPRDGNAAGWFHCSHTSHGQKTLADILAVLPESAVLAATADLCEDAAHDQAAREDYEAAERLAIMEEM